MTSRVTAIEKHGKEATKMLFNHRRVAAAMVAHGLHSLSGAPDRAGILKLLRQGRNLRDETLDHAERGRGNRARRRAGTFNESWHDDCPDSYSPCSHEWIFQVEEERRQWHQQKRDYPTKSRRRWIILRAIEDGWATKMPMGGAKCTHQGCKRNAVVAERQPDASEVRDCYYHLTHQMEWCNACQALRVITDFKSGSSMGGLGTLEVWTMDCGHSDGFEDDPIHLYI